MKYWLSLFAVCVLTACGGGGGSSSSGSNQPPLTTPDEECSSEQLLLCMVGTYKNKHSYLTNLATWTQLTISENGDFSFQGDNDLSFSTEQVIELTHSGDVISLRVQMSDHEKTFSIYTQNDFKQILDIEYNHDGLDYGVILSDLPIWNRTPAGQLGNGISATVGGVLYAIYRSPVDAQSYADHDGLYLSVNENQATWTIEIDDDLGDYIFVCGNNVSLQLQLNDEIYTAEVGECEITITSYELKSNGDIDYIDARFVAQLKPSTSNNRWLRINDGIFRFDVN